MDEKDKGVIQEKPSTNDSLIIVKNWDHTTESLRAVVGLEGRAEKIGFALPTLVELLNREFPTNMTVETVRNGAGQVIDEVSSEVLSINDRPLDHMRVVAYPPAANTNLQEMTQFKAGGEVVLMLDGAAELTYAEGIVGGVIPQSSLKTEKVESGDLMISTDTPNNWTKVFGDKFSFVYIVGNPDGPQKYGDVPKEKILVK